MSFGTAVVFRPQFLQARQELDSVAVHFRVKSQVESSRCNMKRSALVLALTGSCVLAASVASTPAFALETYEAKMEAGDAASQARVDMSEAFGPKALKPGQYVWRDVQGDGPERMVISLSDQLAYFYRGDVLVAAAAISTGIEGRDTPTGIFAVLDK